MLEGTEMKARLKDLETLCLCRDDSAHGVCRIVWESRSAPTAA